ncbi:MAG: Ig-like domain-containing protein [Burkholderiales bacterium]
MNALIRIVVALFSLALSFGALAAPTVSMTSPANGSLYLAPGTLPVKANASAPGVGINRVEFYANGALINTDTSAPYQFDWTGVAAGSYAITAKAVDNNGAETLSAPRTITVAATNTPPTVSLSAPADNARYLNPTSIAISATASGPELNDIVQKVEFYLNGVLANTISAAPFSYGATGLAAGTYVLTAVATDSQNAQTTSTARTFIVTDMNTPPTVSLVTPVANSAWNGPTATVPMSVSVSSGEANDTVSVEFFANGTSLGVRPSAPYSITASLASATYSISAVATDGQGAQTTSAARTIVVSDTNNPPTVSLSAPTQNQNFPNPPIASITLSATAGAGEVNGWVTKVEFYANGTLLATDSAGPFGFAWTNVPQGLYAITAIAYDNFNAATTSAPINIKVGNPVSLYFVHVDHLNTSREIYNQAQQLVWRHDQAEPFGSNPADENPSGLGAFEFPLRDQGTYADKETARIYNWNRYRDPNDGRFLQADPLGLKGGDLSLYVLRKNNPLTYLDPTGLVNWKGTFGGLGYSIGGGGAVFGYQLTSECKCGQRVTITGFASGLTAGVSLKPGSVSGSGAEFYDYLDCPDPGIANGLFAMSSANLVIGTGPGYSKIQLGGLRSYNNLGDQNYGFDISIGIYLGTSAVTDAKVECCK